MNRKTLYNIAYRIRKKVLNDGNPTNRCVDASRALVAALKMRGKIAKLYAGQFRSDTYLCYHTWVTCRGLIIDTTADQFNELMNKPLPKIMIVKVPSNRHLYGRLA